MMTKEQLHAEMLYQTTMCIVKQMLDEGIITEDDYREVEDVFVEKYDPVIGKLFSSLEYYKFKNK